MKLVEIYETDEGLYHHWVESRETYPDFEAWIREVGGEIQLHSFQKNHSEPLGLIKLGSH